MTYFEVAVAAPIYNTLTYKSPVSDDISLEPGQRVLVPLGRRLITGYCLQVDLSPPEKVAIKRVNRVLDEELLFQPNMIPLFRWAADYYHYPIGEVIKSALPAGLTPKSKRTIQITELGQQKLLSIAIQTKYEWLTSLLKIGHLRNIEVKKLWKSKERKLLEQWHDQNYIVIKSIITKDTVRQKIELCVRLSSKYINNSWPDNLKKSEIKTLDLLVKQLSDSNFNWIARKDLARVYPGARKAILSLNQQGIVDIKDRVIYRDPFGMRPPHFPKPAQLTDEQQTVLDSVNPEILKGIFAPFLLHGVTGSGKTEIYLRAAETALAQNRSVLVLVPEIALATQLEGHFLSRFGSTVALLHSGLTAGEKFDQWQRVIKGKALIVIGARSAIFAPLKTPGLIIVDEEHDSAYKQDDGFRYNGRDMAVLRGKQQDAVVILGSATPSVNSYFHALNNKYTLLSMENRVSQQQMPSVEVIDLRLVKTTSGLPPLFSPQLSKGLRENFRDGNQSLVFLNRRGYASQMICKDCGHTVQCNQCNVTLTLHQKRNQLVCHYCGYTTHSAIICSSCKSNHVVGIGFGTERIEEELRKLIPDAAISRLDQDTSGKRNSYLKILKKVHQRKIDILIGTQMIAKGHHFPHVTLVCVVWADAGLGIPDYRSGERTFQLLTQVYGRAGRGEKTGQILAQTHNPEHYSISSAKEHDFLSLYNHEIELRQKLAYPPFTRLVNFLIEGKSETHVKKSANFLTNLAKKRSGKTINVLGPAPAPISKLRGLYRWQFIINATQIVLLKNLCKHLSHVKVPGVAKTSIKLSVDVDPENML